MIRGLPYGAESLAFHQHAKDGRLKAKRAGHQPKGKVGGHKKSGKLPAFLSQGIPHGSKAGLHGSRGK